MKNALSRNIVYLCAAGIICIAGFFLVLHTGQANTTSIWKQYRIIAVPPEANLTELLTFFDFHEITGIASANTARIRMEPPWFPEPPWLLQLNKRIEQWFIDDERGYRFIFIPDQLKRDNVLATVAEETGIPLLIEPADKIVSLLPIALIIAIIAGMFLVKNRIWFLCMTLPQLILVSTKSGIIAYLSSSLFIAGSFIYCISWSSLHHVMSSSFLRKQIFRFHPAMLLGAGSITASCLAGPRFLLASLITGFCTGSLIYIQQILREIYAVILNWHRIHPQLTIYPMHPRYTSFRIPPSTLKKLIAISVILAGVYFPFSRNTVAVSANSQDFGVLSIPRPTGYTAVPGLGIEAYEECITTKRNELVMLPDLTDFIGAHWNMNSIPWNRINSRYEIPQQGSSVEYILYSADESGRILADNQILYQFDKRLLKETLSDLQNPLAQLLIRQDNFVFVHKSRNGL